MAVNEKEALASEIQKKTYVASNQRGSGVDAQRINSQLSELKSRLSQADKELSDLDRELNADEQLYSQEKMSVSLSIIIIIAQDNVYGAVTYNSKAIVRVYLFHLIYAEQHQKAADRCSKPIIY